MYARYSWLTHTEMSTHLIASVYCIYCILCHVFGVGIKYIRVEEKKEFKASCKLQVDIHFSDINMLFHYIQNTVKLCYKNNYITEQSLCLCKTQCHTCTYNQEMTTWKTKEKLEFLNFAAVDFTLCVCMSMRAHVQALTDVLHVSGIYIDRTQHHHVETVKLQSHSVIKLFFVFFPLVLRYVAHFSVVQVPAYLWHCSMHFKGQGENGVWHPSV
jgi:hypothetical protein